MKTLDSNAIHLELKYCERCGGLWLRLQGSEVVFCPACAIVLAGVSRDPRFRVHGNAIIPLDGAEQVMENSAWSEGGNA